MEKKEKKVKKVKRLKVEEVKSELPKGFNPDLPANKQREFRT